MTRALRWFLITAGVLFAAAFAVVMAVIFQAGLVAMSAPSGPSPAP